MTNKKIVETLDKEIIAKEKDVLTQIGYMKEHGFKMEEEALRYQLRGIQDVQEIIWSLFKY